MSSEVQKALATPLTAEQERRKRNRKAFAKALLAAGPEKLREARASLHYTRAANGDSMLAAFAPKKADE
jgi:hypothetical protein